MKAILLLLMLLVAVRPSISCAGQGGGRSVKHIGAGTSYASPYYVYETSKPGPVVLLEAGIHGDEIAGVLALDALLDSIQVLSGTLIVFPRMNVPACRAEKRLINKDLNKIFPGGKGNAYEDALAREIYEMVGQEGVEYVVTLHESWNLHDPKTKKGVAQTVIYGVQPPPNLLQGWLQSLNENATESGVFHPLYYPVANSSTEIFVEAYGLKGGFCVETWRSFPLEKRVSMHLRVARTFLDTIGMRYELLE